jgi:predicted PurR-regulated permease PerM
VVARGANLPTTLVFLGALGGLLIWGVVGIFLGPVILALCLELILWWLQEDRAARAVQNMQQIES